MRPLLAAVSLSLLAGCTDRSLPTGAHLRRQLTADLSAQRDGRPTDGRPMVPYDGSSRDNSPVLARIEAMTSASLAPVPIPPDAFSRMPDAVHPDVTCAPAAWNGSRCWIAYTPYAGSDPAWENPSVLIMRAETQWNLPDGVVNPVVPYPGATMYNSDPDQTFDPGTGRLVTFYREVAGGYNNIYAIATADGHRWSTPRLAFREPEHDAVSPAIVLEPSGRARVWYVASGVGCSAPITSVRVRTAQLASGQPLEQATWSGAQPVKLDQPGFSVWHMDVIAVPELQGYVAILADHATNRDCAADDLWLATSSDGINWSTYPVPVLWRAMAAAKRLGIGTWYRAALRYDAATDSLHIWPSAMTTDQRWVVFHTAVNFTSLLRALLAATPADQPTEVLRMQSPVPPALRVHMP